LPAPRIDLVFHQPISRNKNIWEQRFYPTRHRERTDNEQVSRTSKWQFSYGQVSSISIVFATHLKAY